MSRSRSDVDCRWELDQWVNRHSYGHEEELAGMPLPDIIHYRGLFAEPDDKDQLTKPQHTKEPMTTITSPVVVYADGACKNNPGPGGWAAIILTNAGADKRVLTGGEAETTNNRMELTGPLEALKAVADVSGTVVITLDSKYVVEGMKTWLPKWKSNGWKTADKKPVKNRDLWTALDEAASARAEGIQWRWTKGHASNALNIEADTLASAEAEKQAAAIGEGE